MDSKEDNHLRIELYDSWQQDAFQVDIAAMLLNSLNIAVIFLLAYHDFGIDGMEPLVITYFLFHFASCEIKWRPSQILTGDHGSDFRSYLKSTKRKLYLRTIPAFTVMIWVPLQIFS